MLPACAGNHASTRFQVCGVQSLDCMANALAVPSACTPCSRPQTSPHHSAVAAAPCWLRRPFVVSSPATAPCVAFARSSLHVSQPLLTRTLRRPEGGVPAHLPLRDLKRGHPPPASAIRSFIRASQIKSLGVRLASEL